MNRATCNRPRLAPRVARSTPLVVLAAFAGWWAACGTGCTASDEIPQKQLWAEQKLVVMNRTRQRLADFDVAYDGFARHADIVDMGLHAYPGIMWDRPAAVPEKVVLSWTGTDGVRREKEVDVGAQVPAAHRGRIRLKINPDETVDVQSKPDPAPEDIAFTVYNAGRGTVRHVIVAIGPKRLAVDAARPHESQWFPIGLDKRPDAAAVVWLDPAGQEQQRTIPLALPPGFKGLIVIRFRDGEDVKAILITRRMSWPEVRSRLERP